MELFCQRIVKKYVTCEATRKPVVQREPLKMSYLPNRQYERLKADFCVPLPSGDYL